ncbi:MAG: MinD/ParA family protein [Microbacteriaceae bacterium]|nr:MinD/ParA family protein [Microbacteriaceae bacterium]
MAEKRARTTPADPTAAAASVAEGVEPVGDAVLAAALPASLTIEVELPAPVREQPEDEQAVAIVETGVDPAVVQVLELGTTVIELDDDALQAVAVAPELQDEREAEVPPLPVAEKVYSRRDMLDGVHHGPESAAMLTADRLIEPRRRNRSAPEGAWPAFVYAITFHLVNLGDSAKVRARKELDATIATAFEGGARFVPVLTRKGGVGKTTITTLLGMALASVRDDRVIAIDANPDRGTLSERVARQTRATVRDVVNRAPSIQGFTDFSTLVSRDETRLDILASDTDPMLSEAFDENDYNVVADLAARYYSIVLTDCGTGIVHSVMRATLQRADALVIVSGGSVDEARLASETLTWLEANGYGDLVRESIVAINTATQGTNLVKLEEIEAHFASRVRQIVRIPYDELLAAGSVISWRDLRPLTRQAARELAALIAQGMTVRRGV